MTDTARASRWEDKREGKPANAVDSAPSDCTTVSDGRLSRGNANVGDRIGRTRRPAHPMDTISGGPIGPSDRPLTKNMSDVLKTLNGRRSIYATTPPRRGLYPREMTQAERNAAKALHNRGLANWDAGCWQITEAGIAALSVSSHHSNPEAR